MADNSSNPRRSMEGDGSNVARLRESVIETGREPSRTTPPAAEAASAQTKNFTRDQPRRRRLRHILLLLGPVLLVLAGLYLYLSGGRYVSTDNAYVKADKDRNFAIGLVFIFMVGIILLATLALLNLGTSAGRAALNSEITRQALIIAYADDFKLMMIVALSAMPLVFLLRGANQRRTAKQQVLE